MPLTIEQTEFLDVFLKADSMGGILVLKDNRTNKTKLKIKLEINTNPPAGGREICAKVVCGGELKS